MISVRLASQLSVCGKNFNFKIFLDTIIMILNMTFAWVMQKVILNRLKPQVEKIVAEEQAGFRAGRSTTEQIVNLLIHCEKYISSTIKTSTMSS